MTERRSDAAARRGRMRRAVAPAVYLVVAVVLGVVSAEPRFATPIWWTVALGVGGLAILAVRARHPLVSSAGALLLAVLSLAVGTGAEAVLVVIAIFGVGVRLRPALAWASFGAAAVLGAVAAWVFTTRLATGPSLWGSPPVTPRDAASDWIVTFAVVVAVLLITTLFGTNVGQRRRYVGTLIERADQLARERDQQAEIAAAGERERIAREMHDVIAHSLSVMIAISDGARAATDGRPAEAKVAMSRVSETGRRTLGEVRRLLGGVRRVAGSLDAAHAPHAAHAPQPDAAQLPALVEQFTAAGLPVRMTTVGAPTDDPAMGLTVYRIVQESLTNVLRHARQVTAVLVALTWTGDGVTIVVEDSAAPAASSAGSSSRGRGLVGMAERAALFDGVVESGPRPGGGWRVRAHLQGGER